ncbi:MAG: tryptophan 2,3-dioxygenase family protein, partial [Kofleriaceae bacterium]
MTENRRELEPTIHVELDKGGTYGDYLHLDELLAAQRPVTAVHDEMLFIIQHHTSELWIKLMLHELEYAVKLIRADRLAESFKIFARVAHIQTMLFEQWAVLETMTPSEYLQFRDALGRASGFQSYQYRALVFALWVISMMGAYFAFLINAPVKERDEKTNTMSIKMVAQNPSDPKSPMVPKRDNQYPMGIDLAGGTELIYILKYDQIDENIRSTQKRIDDAKAEASKARESSSEESKKLATKLDDSVRQLQDNLEGLKKSKDSAPDKAAE